MNSLESSIKNDGVDEVGSFLSGIDSSIISILAKKFFKEDKTFTVGFDESAYDESNYAKIAKLIGSDQ